MNQYQIDLNQLNHYQIYWVKKINIKFIWINWISIKFIESTGSVSNSTYTDSGEFWFDRFDSDLKVILLILVTRILFILTEWTFMSLTGLNQNWRSVVSDGSTRGLNTMKWIFENVLWTVCAFECASNHFAQAECLIFSLSHSLAHPPPSRPHIQDTDLLPPHDSPMTPPQPAQCSDYLFITLQLNSSPHIG